MKIALFAIFITFFTSYSHAFLSSSKRNYIEVGTGATQFGFAEDFLQEYNVAPATNLKLLFGGRIHKSPNAWFELGYTYNGAFFTEDSSTDVNGETDVTQTIKDKFSSQSISLGLRFTTNPYRRFASFMRFGGGQMITQLRSDSTEVFADNTLAIKSSSFEEYKETYLYGALGFSFQVNRYNRVSFEAQQNQYSIETADFEDNLASISWVRYF